MATVRRPSTPASAAARVVAFPVVPENPYQRLFYAALAPHGVQHVSAGGEAFEARWLHRARSRVEILHFHWPQCYYTRWSPTEGPLASRWSWVKLGVFAVRLLAARVLGFRLVWTIHEVTPFESTDPLLEWMGANVLARACHVLLANDSATVATARLTIGRQADRVHVVPHGSFVGHYPPGRPPEVVRKELGIAPDHTVFLSFGNLRGYKNLDVLLEAFRGVADPRASLVVAGLPMDEGSAQALDRAARDDARVKPLLGFVAEDQVAELFEMSDVSVLARGDGGTSSVLVLSLSMGKPVIAADVPAYREMTAEGETGWFFAPGDPESMAAALTSALDADQRAPRAAAARRRADRLEWAGDAGGTAKLLIGNAG